jgi:dienelactone hydrolase
MYHTIMITRYLQFFFTFILVTFILAACDPPGLSASATPAAYSLYSSGSASPITDGGKTLSTTPFITPVTLTPTITLSPTVTATPTITPTIPFANEPMSIQVARSRTYPGSDIVIDQELAPGSNYHRYYAWYLSDGLKIFGLLTVPFGSKPEGGWPAVVFNHGYFPPYTYSTTGTYISHVESLASHGYVVFKIDYRGNSGSQGSIPYAYGEPGYTDDVLNALSSLARYPQVNPNKISMWGHSMGGFMTLRAMVISKNIKAGVIWSGVVGSYADLICCWYAHPIIFPTPFPGVHTGWQSWIQEHGTPEQDPRFWNAISATSYLADLSGPLQLHHGLYDTEVPYAFSESLAAGVQAAGKTVELYSYQSNDHNLASSYSQAMTRTLQFLDHYLK